MLKGILKKKLNNDKGFTLAELLIVVAIIAILVAVSIPVFTSQLDKAKASTDKANERAAKAAASAQYLSGDTTTTYYYDAEEGVLEKTPDDVKTAYGQTDTTKDKILEVDVNITTGKITLSWVSKSKQ